VLSFVGTVLVLAAAFLALLWAFQRRLIYLPSTARVPPASGLLAGGEDVSLRARDGLVLGGWFVKGRPPSHGGPPVTFLVFNGNAGDRSHRVPLAETLRSTGAGVLLFDYRGYGGNPGSPTEAGLAADARAALEFLDASGEASGSRLVYFGESLGAAVALELALERPPAALVLRSPFTSLAEVARVHYWYIPVPMAWLLWDRYPSIERAEKLRCPVLVIAGERDRIIPATQSRRLYETAPEPKRLVVVPNADHNDPGLCDGGLWLAPMVEFLERVGLGPGVGSGP
jgi:hypothetical protein